MAKSLIITGILVALLGGGIYINKSSMRTSYTEYNFLSQRMERVDNTETKAAGIRNGLVITALGIVCLLVGVMRLKPST